MEKDGNRRGDADRNRNDVGNADKNAVHEIVDSIGDEVHLTNMLPKYFLWGAAHVLLDRMHVMPPEEFLENKEKENTAENIE